MLPTEVSNITQAFSQQALASTQEKSTVETTVNVPVAVAKQVPPVDTVSIANKSAPVISDVKNDATKKTANKSGREDTTARTIADVQFAYNFKGDLQVRFMDRDNRLIYQIPPEFLSRIEESISQPNSSVDTKA